MYRDFLSVKNMVMVSCVCVTGAIYQGDELLKLA